MNNKKIRVGILGYGNLGRGVETGIKYNSDMELAGIFTRRTPSGVHTVSGTAVYPTEQLMDMKNDLDVLILCGGSATDLPKQTPEYAKYFNVVDSFDTHAKIPEHFKAVDAAAKSGGHVAAISIGWDPGMFSLNRAIAGAILPLGRDYTFWGKGVSQGHSDAIRRIEGVLDARQYTIPVEEAVDRVRSGETPELNTGDKHTRLCYVVAADGTDKSKIEQEIVTMPNYFSDYDTTVQFISAAEMKEEHAALPHGGVVIRGGNTGAEGDNKQIIEYKLTLDSNPEFTASVLLAYARAVSKLAAEGEDGCYTVFDVAPSYLMEMSKEDMLKKLL